MAIDATQENSNRFMEDLEYIKKGNTSWGEHTRRFIKENNLPASFLNDLDGAMEIGFREEFNMNVKSMEEGCIFSYFKAMQLAEEHGYDIKEAKDALPICYKAIFDRCLYFIEKGVLVEFHEHEARDAAVEGGFSLQKLEEIMPLGLKKQFSNHLELIESGRDDYEKIAETAKTEAEKYGYPVQAVTNAKAVGRKIREEIIEAAQKAQKKDDSLEMKIKIRK